MTKSQKQMHLGTGEWWQRHLIEDDYCRGPSLQGKEHLKSGPSSGMRKQDWSNVCGLQVENEYGFCGSSKNYIRSLIATAKAAFGEEMIIFTTDPPSIVERGSIAGDQVYTWDYFSCDGSPKSTTPSDHEPSIPTTYLRTAHLASCLNKLELSLYEDKWVISEGEQLQRIRRCSVLCRVVDFGPQVILEIIWSKSAHAMCLVIAKETQLQRAIRAACFCLLLVICLTRPSIVNLCPADGRRYGIQGPKGHESWREVAAILQRILVCLSPLHLSHQATNIPP